MEPHQSSLLSMGILATDLCWSPSVWRWSIHVNYWKFSRRDFSLSPCVFSIYLANSISTDAWVFTFYFGLWSSIPLSWLECSRFGFWEPLQWLMYRSHWGTPMFIYLRNGLTFCCYKMHRASWYIPALSWFGGDLVAKSHLATLWAVARRAPLSMGFSRKGYWSGLPFPSPGDLPDPGNQTQVFCIAGRFFTDWATREALASS